MAEVKRGYVDASIGQVHYRFAGKGKALLLLHAHPSSSHFYEPVMRVLGDAYYVVAPDLPGFGMSAYPPRQPTVPEYAGVVLELLDALKVTRTSIFGSHTGSAVACEIAASAPKRVEKVILSGPPCYDAQERRAWLAKAQGMVLKEDGSHLTTIWERMAHHNFDLEGRHEELVWRLKAGPRHIEAYKAVFNYDMPARLKLVQAPALVMAGEHDSLRGPVEYTARLIKDARTKVIPGAGMMMAYQDPAGTARIIRDFLEGR
ncbi:MAG: alpha/beta hydrolase [Chloroflexi bacterium]|nr:alpha/beta hydrolase [Chloroflexota bacterium]